MNNWTNELVKDGVAVKLDKVQSQKLTDDDLEDVSGGFIETTKGLATFGYNIKCPDCQATAASNFDPRAWQDSKMHSVEYHCNCGCQFVCYDGYVIKKANWINMCNKKNYKYPYS